MNSKTLLTGLGIVGGAMAIVGEGLNIAKTVDEMKHGVKLRDDQLATLSINVSNQVTTTIANNADVFAGLFAERIAQFSKKP